MRSGAPESTTETTARPVKQVRGQSADFVYDRLRADILTLKVPPGEELDETILSKRFDVSRTPVREALIRLASEKLVLLSRNRRATVPPIDLAAFPGYLEALDLLQRAVTRLAATRRSDTDLAKIAAAQSTYSETLSAPDTLAAVEANMGFHLAIADAANNPQLADAYRRLLIEGVRYMQLSFSVHSAVDAGHEVHMGSVSREHDDMIAAIRAHDAGRAEQLAHDHVDLFRRRIAGYLEVEGTSGIAVGL